MISIVGAGPSGLLMQLALPESRVFEKAEKLNFSIMKAYALNKKSIDFLDQHNVMSYISPQEKGVYTDMRIFVQGSLAEIHFSANEINEPFLGMVIEHAALMQALDKVRPLNGVQFNATVQGITSQGLHINNQEVFCDAIIAPDGAQSRIRDYAGIPTKPISYGQKAISAVVEVFDHQNTAWQMFTVHGPIALLPLAEKNRASLIVSSTQADTLMTLNETDFNAFLAQNAPLPARLITQRQLFPLYHHHAQTYFADKVVLIADAAHQFHPLAGLGLNCGIADIISLSRHLQKSHSIHSAYRRYARERWHHNGGVLQSMGILNQIFMHNNPVFGWIRDHGVAVIEKTSFFKQWIAQQASGYGLSL